MAERQALTLFELNSRIRMTLESGLPELYWVTAEISELSVNYRSGHAYVELVEKDPDGETILAKSRATIWASAFRTIKPFFETSTGQSLAAGLKVLVRVSVEFHEVYQLSLNIRDIDPTYTLGDLARQKQEVIRKLEEAGVLEMNRSLQTPLVIQKIAIISSPTAAGYGDFMNQLKSNGSQYHFETDLFEAILQGEEAATTITEAFSRIADSATVYDVVVIIRGGGSKLDLNCFDQFDLNFFAAQFPIPIVTGIGHERDDTVLDMIAHTRCKTPTAAAEWVLSITTDFDQMLDDHAYQVTELAKNHLNMANERIVKIMRNLPLRIEQQIGKAGRDLDILLGQAKKSIDYRFKEEKQRLMHIEKQAELHDPVHILKKGYSMVMIDNKAIKSSSQVKVGSPLHITLFDGSLDARVETIIPREKTNKKKA